MESSCEGEKNWLKQYRAPILKEPDFLRRDMKFPVQILRSGEPENINCGRREQLTVFEEEGLVVGKSR